MIVDESHAQLPQVRGMYAGDRPQDDAGRARLPPATAHGQPAAEVRRIGRQG